MGREAFRRWPPWVMNLGTEIAGAVAIYLILNRFIGGRERREVGEREMESHKKELIARMGSPVQDVAVEAAAELRRRGWLTDGSLQGANLEAANLQGARLWGAELQRARLRGAKLQGARLWGAKLQGAHLGFANLQGASLVVATTFDENTWLPDSTKWTPDTDVARFTDSNHPEFWRSSEPDSPAYQPKEQE